MAPKDHRIIPVTFKVIMNIQRQLGFFDPENGDKVLVNYWQGGETHQLALQQPALTDGMGRHGRFSADFDRQQHHLLVFDF